MSLDLDIYIYKQISINDIRDAATSVLATLLPCDFPSIEFLVKKNGEVLEEYDFEALDENIFIQAHFAGRRAETLITTVFLAADAKYNPKEGLCTGATSGRTNDAILLSAAIAAGIAKLADAIIEDHSCFWVDQVETDYATFVKKIAVPDCASIKDFDGYCDAFYRHIPGKIGNRPKQ